MATATTGVPVHTFHHSDTTLENAGKAKPEELLGGAQGSGFDSHPNLHGQHWNSAIVVVNCCVD